ncbi:hypothetical protein BU14_0084s0003 [Porphyra umbilicalis]|uniref:Nucleotide-diphospho-sugar transferase domain-containing protein n=1 Tax=Porphyra umbilicalis TaxID=2786 RepID=A0A1X6PE74_PORUM|nr:hypothetical protein BU14_0084s0003 [Porphyra umbilicalis]|eukprot:OSX79189.1 hypothetical protein BU14_0084s0003 [Porphyra umbilicalis]
MGRDRSDRPSSRRSGGDNVRGGDSVRGGETGRVSSRRSRPAAEGDGDGGGSSRGRVYKTTKAPAPSGPLGTHSLSSWLMFWSAALLLFSFFQLRGQSRRLSDPLARLALPDHNLGEHVGDFSSRLADFSFEIFSAPKPFVGSDKINNERAIRSWLRLRPMPRITLLGNETGYEEAAATFGLRIENRVDKNFLGVPLFNSMLNRANQSTAAVTLIVNGDILLFDDFVQTLRKILSSFENFFVVGARYDVDALPTDVAEDSPTYASRVRAHVLREGTLHTYGGMDVWAWNTGGPRLFDSAMPHFIFGRGKYDNWLTHETISAGRRQVIDVSETCLTVHVRHDYHLVSGGGGGATGGDPGVVPGAASGLAPATADGLVPAAAGVAGAVGAAPVSRRRLLGQFWSEGKKSKFELFINIYLSLHHGTYTNQVGSVLFAPWKLSRCLEPTGMCLLKRVRPGICNCEFSSFVSNTQTDPVVKNGSRVIRCGMTSVETKEDFVIPVLPPEGVSEPPFGLPLTMESVVEKVIINNTVVLSALNYGYRAIMMNWVCNMRHLGVTNFVIAALDPRLYRYAYKRGLPVYYETTIFKGLDSKLVEDADYGTDQFKQLTKMKSRVVLRLLKSGYNVLWTDCDIVWFRNPLSYLHAQHADLVVQSNARDDEAANGKRRINSGFYLAHANPPTIQLFEEIVKYASRSTMSEQPHFWERACGKDGEFRVGNDACYNAGVTTALLNRQLFPNGVTDGIWDSPPGKLMARFPHLYILHANWVKGAAAKQERFERHGFIFFDNQELCVYPSWRPRTEEAVLARPVIAPAQHR